MVPPSSTLLIGTEPATVLGASPSRIPTAGKIRAGIMVLTAKAAEHPKAQTLYDEGVAAGNSFEQIGRAINEAVPALKHPLAPRNVPWFTVRPQDFAHPEVARQILEAYGEDRGEGLRLYRFPVVFPSDHWQTVMPHELAAWGANEKRFWSHYSPDGRTRHCMQHAPVPVDNTGRRTVRLFGGRRPMEREHNGGLCEPEACPEYQKSQCNLTGRFVFFIPGIASLSAFELHTNSFYAMNAAIQKFKTVAFLRGGRLSGFLDRKGTTFFLSKRLMEVPHIDDHGRAVRVSQWIIDLEAPVDVTALLREAQDEDAVLLQAGDAVRVLQGSVSAEPASVAQPTGDSARDDEPAVSRGGNPSAEQIAALASRYGIEPARFNAYANQRWGQGWKLNPHGRNRVWEELERHRNDPKGYAEKIDAALREGA
jgi:hypothetical protein